MNKMRNIVVLDRSIPIVNGWNEGPNNIIRCVKIREMESSVTSVQEEITGGGYREKRRKCTNL